MDTLDICQNFSNHEHNIDRKRTGDKPSLKMSLVGFQHVLNLIKPITACV